MDIGVQHHVPGLHSPSTRRLTLAFAAAPIVAASVLLACRNEEVPVPVIDPGDGGAYAPVIDPSAFTSEITNPYLPLGVGSSWTLESEDGSERIEIEVLDETRPVIGVVTRVVRERAYEDGELVEETLDWFAQDRDGNVWYFGEDSRDIEDGAVVSTDGSWEAGIDGAEPGIVMLAAPSPGDAYRQEYYPGEAEDMGEVLRLDASASTPAGSFGDLLIVEEWTPLEPDVVEEKAYAAGIGLVEERKVRGDSGELLLVEFVLAE